MIPIFAPIGGGGSIPLQTGESLPAEALKAPAEILALCALLLVLILSIKLLDVLSPMVRAWSAARPVPAKQYNPLNGAADRIDSWLLLTRDLIKQVERSVDNSVKQTTKLEELVNTQVLQTTKIDDLAKAVAHEIKLAEARVIEHIDQKRKGDC